MPLTMAQAQGLRSRRTGRDCGERNHQCRAATATCWRKKATSPANYDDARFAADAAIGGGVRRRGGRHHGTGSIATGATSSPPSTAGPGSGWSIPGTSSKPTKDRSWSSKRSTTYTPTSRSTSRTSPWFASTWPATRSRPWSGCQPTTTARSPVIRAIWTLLRIPRCRIPPARSNCAPPWTTRTATSGRGNSSTSDLCSTPPSKLYSFQLMHHNSAKKGSYVFVIGDHELAEMRRTGDPGPEARRHGRRQETGNLKVERPLSPDGQMMLMPNSPVTILPSASPQTRPAGLPAGQPKLPQASSGEPQRVSVVARRDDGGARW